MNRDLPGDSEAIPTARPVQSNGSLARHQGPSTSASTPSLRTLAIDLGTKRVGLALSDEGGRWATPHEVLFVTDPAQAIEPILKLIKTEDVKRIVVGLPLNMDGTQGPATQKTIAWTTGLAASAASSSITVEILYIDERLSSFAAEQQLTERKKAGEKLTHKRKKQQLDAVAAAGFLQAFLDGKLQPIDMSRT